MKFTEAKLEQTIIEQLAEQAYAHFNGAKGRALTSQTLSQIKINYPELFDYL